MNEFGAGKLFGQHTGAAGMGGAFENHSTGLSGGDRGQELFQHGQPLAAAVGRDTT